MISTCLFTFQKNPATQLHSSYKRDRISSTSLPSLPAADVTCRHKRILSSNDRSLIPTPERRPYSPSDEKGTLGTFRHCICRCSNRRPPITTYAFLRRLRVTIYTDFDAVARKEIAEDFDDNARRSYAIEVQRSAYKSTRSLPVFTCVYIS